MQPQTPLKTAELDQPKRVVFLDLDLIDTDGQDSTETLNGLVQEEPGTQFVILHSSNHRHSTRQAILSFLVQNQLELPLHENCLTVFNAGHGVSSWLKTQDYSGPWVSFDKDSSRYEDDIADRVIKVPLNSSISYELGIQALDLFEAFEERPVLPTIEKISPLRDDIHELIVQRGAKTEIRAAVMNLTMGEREELLKDIIQKSQTGDLVDSDESGVITTATVIITASPFMQQVQGIQSIVSALTKGSDTESIIKQMADIPTGQSLDNNLLIHTYRLLGGVLSELSEVDGLGKLALTCTKPILVLMKSASNPNIRKLALTHAQQWSSGDIANADRAELREQIQSVQERQ